MKIPFQRPDEDEEDHSEDKKGEGGKKKAGGKGKSLKISDMDDWVNNSADELDSDNSDKQGDSDDDSQVGKCCGCFFLASQEHKDVQGHVLERLKILCRSIVPVYVCVTTRKTNSKADFDNFPYLVEEKEVRRRSQQGL